MKQQGRRPYSPLQKILLVVFILTLLLSVAGAGVLVYGYIQMMALIQQAGLALGPDAASVGIIGSADGPTSIFVGSSFGGFGGTLLLLLPVILCAASGIALLVSRHRSRRA